MATRQWKVARKWVIFYSVILALWLTAASTLIVTYGPQFFIFRGNGTGATSQANNVPSDPQELSILHNPNLKVDAAGNLVPKVTVPGMPVLAEGASGNPVGTAQLWLNIHGANLPVDGSFGPSTESAVVVFQQSDHLPVTGVVNASTWRALEKAP